MHACPHLLSFNTSKAMVEEEVHSQVLNDEPAEPTSKILRFAYIFIKKGILVLLNIILFYAWGYYNLFLYTHENSPSFPKEYFSFEFIQIIFFMKSTLIPLCNHAPVPSSEFSISLIFLTTKHTNYFQWVISSVCFKSGHVHYGCKWSRA